MLNAVRIYKINIRENILRQVIFTDKNLFLGFCAMVLLLIWKYCADWGQDTKVFLTLLCCGGALLAFSLKIDRQPLLRILVRMTGYFNSIRKYRY